MRVRLRLMHAQHIHQCLLTGSSRHRPRSSCLDRWPIVVFPPPPLPQPTVVDEGASIVTLKANKDYYEKIWVNPHSIHPDRLEASKKAAAFVTLTDKYVLADEKHPIEIHSILNNSHNDAFVLAYLPNEKVLVEADAYTPLAPNAPVPTTANPYSVNLYENIQKLNLNVEKIAGIHGPRAVTLADLKTYIGLQPTVIK